MNSSTVFKLGTDAVEDIRKVAVRFTGGGEGFPGTLKLTLALHVSRECSGFTTRVWLLPLGLIVKEEPEIVMSFLSPSCISA